MINYGTEFRVSSDSGASWRRTSPGVGGLPGSAVSRPSVAADAIGTLAFASGGLGEIHRGRSLDGGLSLWTAPNISANAGTSMMARTAGGAAGVFFSLWEDDTPSSGTPRLLGY
ncbi:MAG: hypothetical protein ACYTGX_11935 [Planctomycetota bacterium]|jgi:hypothetical protein